MRALESGERGIFLRPSHSFPVPPQMSVPRTGITVKYDQQGNIVAESLGDVPAISLLHALYDESYTRHIDQVMVRRMPREHAKYVKAGHPNRVSAAPVSAQYHSVREEMMNRFRGWEGGVARRLLQEGGTISQVQGVPISVNFGRNPVDFTAFDARVDERGAGARILAHTRHVWSMTQDSEFESSSTG